MYNKNREREKDKARFHDAGFRQTHSGRSQFAEGEWGTNSEFGRNTAFRESDSAEPKHNRPHGRQYSLAGVDFDTDERDDEFSEREYNRSRFAEPYTGGQFARSQYGMGGQYHRDLYDNSSPGYGTRESGFFGVGPKGYKRSDERIHEEACEALYMNPLVDASDIDVKVNEGVVTLSGTVETRYAKREAEKCVEILLGVVDVHNELRIATNRMEH